MTTGSNNRAAAQRGDRRYPQDRSRPPYWIELLNDAGVPCGPVNDIDQVFDDPQVNHLGVAHEVDHPRLGKLKVVRQPVNLSDRPQPEVFRYATPDAGEHTDRS